MGPNNQPQTTEPTPPTGLPEQEVSERPVPTESNMPADMTGVTPPHAEPVATKKSKKGLVIGLIAGGVVLLGLLAGILVYALVYNKPENVVFDAFANALSAKSGEARGTASIKSTAPGGSDIDIEFTMASNQSNEASGNLIFKVASGDKKATFKTDFAGNDDKLFFKLNNLKESVKEIFGAEIADLFMEYYKDLVTKLDNKWVVITKSEIENLSEDSTSNKESVCMQEQLAKLRTDADVRKEVLDVYKKHPFLKVESKGSDKDGNRYKLTLNEDKANDFGKALVDTKFFKAVDDCTKEDLKKSMEKSSPSSSSSSKTEGSVEIWVDGFSHNLNRVVVNVDGKEESGSVKTNIDVRTKFNTNPVVNMPKADTTLDDIKTEIEDLQEQLSPRVAPSGVYY